MTIYYVVPFSALADYEKVIENFEPLKSPFGLIEIVECTIKAPCLLPRFIVKFKFNCKASDAVNCERYLHGYLFNLLGEFY